MNQLDPKIIKLLTYQNRATIINVIAACGVAIYLSVDALGYGAGAFFLSLGIAWVLIRVFNFITMVILQLKVYGRDIEQLEHDAVDAEIFFNTRAAAVEPIADQIVLQIVQTPETPIGRFMDAPIFEWLDVKGVDDTIHRFTFQGTMDITGGLTRPVPDGCFLIPPGIMYQVEEPVNTPT